MSDLKVSDEYEVEPSEVDAIVALVDENASLTLEVAQLKQLVSDVYACRMEAGEGRFVNLAKLRPVIDRIAAALKESPHVR